MARSSGSNRRTGHYLGTEIEEKWWQRYDRNKLLARGNGECWIDQDALCFLRYLTKDPIKIRFDAIVGVKIAKWHSGRWYCGRPIVKVLWIEDGLKLSSGFIVARDMDNTLRFVGEIKEAVGPPHGGASNSPS